MLRNRMFTSLRGCSLENGAETSHASLTPALNSHGPYSIPLHTMLWSKFHCGRLPTYESHHRVEYPSVFS